MAPWLPTTPLTVDATRFISNSAPTGGAIMISGENQAVSTLTNALFAANIATNAIAAKTATSGAAGTGAAIAKSSYGSLTIRFTTIASPTTGSGDAIYIEHGTAAVTDTIIANYDQSIVEFAAGLVTSDYNLFYDAPTTIDIGAHSLTGNPAFVDPAAGDYDLTAASFAINRGLDVGVYTDYAGDPRPAGGGFDIGFDETTYTTDLAITKAVSPAALAPGATLTYTLAFTNTGTGLVSAITISDTVPLSITVTGVVSGGVPITQTGSLPDIAWQIDNLAAGAGGVITLTAIASPALRIGTVVTNTATITTGLDMTATNDSSSVAFTVIAGACTATPNDGAPVYTSNDAAAVRAAIAAAIPGATVKIAGYCAGAITEGATTQVALITRTLTLAGGYTPADWFTYNPAANPTTLDALGAGRRPLHHRQRHTPGLHRHQRPGRYHRWWHQRRRCHHPHRYGRL